MHFWGYQFLDYEFRGFPVVEDLYVVYQEIKSYLLISVVPYSPNLFESTMSSVVEKKDRSQHLKLLLFSMFLKLTFSPFNHEIDIRSSDENFTFKFEKMMSISDGQIPFGTQTTLTGEFDDFQTFMDQKVLKIFAGILFLLIMTWNNFHILITIDYEIHGG